MERDFSKRDFGNWGRYVRIRPRCIYLGSSSHGLPYSGTRWPAWRDFDHKLDDCIGLSWVEEVSEDEATHLDPNYFSGSDYSGCLVERSNYAAFLEANGDSEGVITYHGGYGSFGILIRLSDMTEEIVEVLEAVQNYPLLDEDHHSQLEMEAQDEAWENWVRQELIDELLKAEENAYADSDVDEDEVIEALEEMEKTFTSMGDGTLRSLFEKTAEQSGEYWTIETGGNAWIDVASVVRSMS